MELYEAIKRRRSVRSYPGKPLAEDELAEVEDLLAEAGSFRDGVDVDARLVENGTEFQDSISGLIADYGKVEAPHYLVLTSEGEERGLVEVGYRYEFVVLALTALGIGTCWIGKGFSDEELSRHVDLPAGQTCRALVAFGPVEEDELAVIEEPKRKDPGEFLVEGDESDLDGRLLELIEALRRAPSSINSQPWRLVADDEGFHLYVGTRSFLSRKLMESLSEMNRIDAGIGLRHLEVAGSYLWGEADLRKIGHPERDGLDYVGSLVVD